MSKAAFSSLLLLLLLGIEARADSLAEKIRLLGVNQAGGEFGKAPGTFKKDYIYPGAEQLDYCQAQGLRLIRLPFKWERVQPKLMRELDHAEVERLESVVKMAGERGLAVLLDMHNYARYGGKLIGTPEVPNAAFADAWRRLAGHFHTRHKSILGYGIMNEPHGTKGLWPAAAQAAVDGIREVDRHTAIFVGGDGYSGAHSWRKFNNDLLLKDPADKLVYEAHQYFDQNNSGSYKKSYDDDGATADVGVRRLQPFLEWLEEHGCRGFIGEFGVPDDDPRWLVVLDNTLAEMQRHHIGGTYWAAGPWWGNYPLSIEPRDGQDRPQLEVLRYYLSAGHGPAARPWLAAAAEAQAAAQRIKEEDARLGKRVYDFRSRKESYSYSNDASEFTSAADKDSERDARKFVCNHQGNPAWIGWGSYFGSIDCRGHESLTLELRAAQPCRLQIKAYDTKGKRFTASYPIGTDWQTLTIGLADLKHGEEPYTAANPLEKLEFQPTASPSKNTLFFGPLRLVPSP